jgi:spore germination protein GerM
MTLTARSRIGRRSAMALAVAVALAGAGCASTTTTPAPTTTASTTTSVTTTSSSTTAPTTAPTTTTVATTVAPPTTAVPASTVSVYLVRGQRLGVTRRSVPVPAVLRGALVALLEGPSAAERDEGLTTAIPAGTRLRSVALADGTATIDLSREFQSGGGTLSMSLRLAEVVFTATQFGNVDRVALRIEGTPISVLGGEGLVLPDPLVRSSIPHAVSGGILVVTPRPGATVRSPLVVTGEGDVYEGEFSISVVRGSTEVASVRGIRTGAWGTWGPFTATIPLDVASGPIRMVITDPNPCGDDPSCPPDIVTEIPLTVVA